MFEGVVCLPVGNRQKEEEEEEERRGKESGLGLHKVERSIGERKRERTK